MCGGSEDEGGKGGGEAGVLMVGVRVGAGGWGRVGRVGGGDAGLGVGINLEITTTAGGVINERDIACPES